jgi:DNA adenine methylase
MRYPGGKGKCYQHLINLMPRHSTYIESYLGGGAVLRHKLPAKRNIGIDSDHNALARWQDVLPDHTELVNANAIDFLTQFPFVGNELVYCDPPYLPETRRGGRLYRHEYDASDHERMLDVLLKLPCMVMLSGYANALYAERLSHWRTHTFMAKSHTDRRQEVVWMNFAKPTVLHDTRFCGANFRQRQGIQRRRQTLQRRISAMGSYERTDLIQWMSITFREELQEALCS